MSIEEIIACNLKEVRLMRGLTQEAVAGRANLQSNYYAYVERSQKMLSIPSLDKVAKVLKVKAFLLLKPDGFRDVR